jgi:hypothetical protein
MENNKQILNFDKKQILRDLEQKVTEKVGFLFSMDGIKGVTHTLKTLIEEISILRSQLNKYIDEDADIEYIMNDSSYVDLLHDVIELMHNLSALYEEYSYLDNFNLKNEFENQKSV